MASTQTVSSKSQEEIVTLYVDFSPVAESVTAPEVTENIPGLVKIGLPTVDGAKVSQQFSGGVVGQKYNIKFSASLPNGDRYTQILVLPVTA